MSGQQLRHTRAHLGLTQQQAARRWKVSQAYLSLMEGGRRRVPERLARQLARAEPRLATALPLRLSDREVADLPKLLGSLGYPGYEYLAGPRTAANPAAVVLAGLKASAATPRVTEALPWVLTHFPGLDWEWLVREVKLANLQNRLGYLVSLAKHLAEARQDATAVDALDEARRQLEDARLAKEDTLGRQVTEAERQYFRQHRPEAAARWNLLTTLRAEDLRYA